MTDTRKAGLDIIGEMLSPEMAAEIATAGGSGAFAAEIGELSIQNVFASIWSRPGLDRRSRSLVTLGILIALRAHDEMGVHFAAALKNGLSVRELEEVIYQATAYAGFPAAMGARKAALEALRKVKAID